jgi:hypothetical protein
MIRGRVTPHRKNHARRVASFQIVVTNELSSKNERKTMHLLLFAPVLASGIWIGGGVGGLILVIVVVVLLLR